MNARPAAPVVPTILALVLLGAGACTSNGRPEPSPARFAEVACPTDVADALPELLVTCGYLTVPARHAEPDAGTIDVFVARIRGTDPVPPGPLIVIGGTDVGAAQSVRRPAAPPPHAAANATMTTDTSH